MSGHSINEGVRRRRVKAAVFRFIICAACMRARFSCNCQLEIADSLHYWWGGMGLMDYSSLEADIHYRFVIKHLDLADDDEVYKAKATRTGCLDASQRHSTLLL